jgi:hypothetical protein
MRMLKALQTETATVMLTGRRMVTETAMGMLMVLQTVTVI